MLFAGIPMMKSAFADTSDVYVKSRIESIQGEMFFAEQKRGSFTHACYTGSIGLIVQDLIKEYGKRVVCRTNTPYHSKMFVYVELRSGLFYAVDSLGISCEHSIEPQQNTFSCKNDV